MVGVILLMLLCACFAVCVCKEYGLVEGIIFFVAWMIIIPLLFYIDAHYGFKPIMLITMPFLAYAVKTEFFDLEEDC